MNKPSDQIIESIAPSYAVAELSISDGYSIRNVAHMETRDTLRLPRGGTHDATFVAVRRYYDGANGGEAGHYLMAWVEFRANGSRWRTAGVKIRDVEAARVARDMLKQKASKPGRNEAPRVGGKTIANDESSLHGAFIDEAVYDTAYLIFVRHKNRGGAWVRTRGVDVRGPEGLIFAGLLKQVASEVK